MKTFQLVRADDGQRSPDINCSPEELCVHLRKIYPEEDHDKFYVLDISIITTPSKDGDDYLYVSRYPLMKVSSFITANEVTTNVNE